MDTKMKNRLTTTLEQGKTIRVNGYTITPKKLAIGWKMTMTRGQESYSWIEENEISWLWVSLVTD